jgi:ubiquinone/menaquinone biosynthesis C-methylase UbiE
MNNATETDIQRAYYGRTADEYDAAHVDTPDEHTLALALLTGIVDPYGIKSVLDVGAGTGRVFLGFAQSHPNVRVVGVEPVKELREIGHRKGVPPDALIDGDGQRLAFADGSFDVVCCFAVLHHVRQPERVIAEMLRVARRAIFISDGNNFGQGSPVSRAVKQAINAAHLWPLANWFKTRGKGYSISDGDGLAYSYSVYNNLPQIRAACPRVHVLNTAGFGVNPYRGATHVALLGFKA